MLKQENQPIKKERSEPKKKRESVIFPSKLKHFNTKDAALFGYDGLCYCAKDSLQLTQRRFVY